MKTKEEKKEGEGKVVLPPGVSFDKPKLRQIVIETDGDNVHLVKAEVSGKIELIGVFQALINYLSKGGK